MDSEITKMEREENLAGNNDRNIDWTTAFWALALVAGIEGAEALLRRVDLPVILRVGIALVPVLPFVFAARAHWRGMMTRGDELARHMARETYVFAFYALLAVFICADLLKAGGVLPDFVWKTKSLLYAMIGTLAVADLWIRRRYR
jgi:hypothetical protein